MNCLYIDMCELRGPHYGFLTRLLCGSPEYIEYKQNNYSSLQITYYAISSHVMIEGHKVIRVLFRLAVMVVRPREMAQVVGGTGS